jgi:hypothetical protein
VSTDEEFWNSAEVVFTSAEFREKLHKIPEEYRYYIKKLVMSGVRVLV